MHYNFFELMEPCHCSELNELARKMWDWPHQRYLSSGAEKQTPRLLYKDSITNLTNVSSVTPFALMFSVVVISLSTEGEKLFNDILATPGTFINMQYIFQLLICYLYWLKKDTYWRMRDAKTREQAKDAIRTMLCLIKNLWPRNKGQEWALPKFHEQLHVPDDIARNGSPQGTNSGPTEHNHIEFVKNPSQQTQKIRAKLDEQLGRRIAETMIIDHSFRSMDFTPKTDELAIPDRQIPGINSSIGIQSLKGRVIIYEGKDGELDQMIIPKKPKDPKPDIDYVEEVVNKLLEQFEDSINWQPYDQGDQYERFFEFNYFSELIRGDDIFWCHPNYRNMGEWKDWIMVRWACESSGDAKLLQPQCWQDIERDNKVNHLDEDIDDETNYCYSPALLAGMFVNIDLLDDDGFLENCIFALTWPCQYKHKKTSVFSTRWELATTTTEPKLPMYELITCDSIIRHCLMIPKSIENWQTCTEYEEIWTTDHWGDQFF